MAIPTISSLIEHACFAQKLSFDGYNHSPAYKLEYFSEKLSLELDQCIGKYYPIITSFIQQLENETLKKELLFSLKEFVFFSNYCLEKTIFPLYVVDICSRHYSKLICNSILFGITHKDVLLYNQHNVSPEPISYSATDMLDFYKQSYLLNLKTNMSLQKVVDALEEHCRLLFFYQLAKDNMTTETLPETDLRLYHGEHRCAYCLQIYKDSSDSFITRKHTAIFKKSKFDIVNEIIGLTKYCLGSGRENTETGLMVMNEAIESYTVQLNKLQQISANENEADVKLKKECVKYEKRLKNLIVELQLHRKYNHAV